jgi:hypothetical protein
MYVNSLMRTCNTHANAGRHLVDRLFGVGSIRKDRRAAYLSPVPPPPIFNRDRRHGSKPIVEAFGWVQGR